MIELGRIFGKSVIERARKYQIQTETSLRPKGSLGEKFSSREFVFLKMFQKTLWQSPWYSNANYPKEIATSPIVLLELLHHSGDLQ